VVRPDLREDHLDDLFLFLVGHDEPVVDDRFDSLALKRDRDNRRLGIELVALVSKAFSSASVPYHSQFA
jgi:hypothetical protein